MAIDQWHGMEVQQVEYACCRERNQCLWLNHNCVDPRTDPCDELWTGVVCSKGRYDPDRRVIGLSVPFNELRGMLPATLGNLPELQSLILSANEVRKLIFFFCFYVAFYPFYNSPISSLLFL